MYVLGDGVWLATDCGAQQPSGATAAAVHLRCKIRSAIGDSTVTRLARAGRIDRSPTPAGTRCV
jgi:hypothetical protein